MINLLASEFHAVLIVGSQLDNLTFQHSIAVTNKFRAQTSHDDVRRNTVSEQLVEAVPHHQQPLWRLLLDNTVGCLLQIDLPIGFRNLLIWREWVLLNTASFTHKQRTPHVTLSFFCNPISQLFREIETFFLAHSVQTLRDFLFRWRAHTDAKTSTPDSRYHFAC